MVYGCNFELASLSDNIDWPLVYPVVALCVHYKCLFAEDIYCKDIRIDELRVESVK